MGGGRYWRRVDGVLVLNKPKGLSSNAALQRVRTIFAAAKAGHTGSLDPLATGVLPICFGEATKLSRFLLDADKEYETTIRLGVVTDTGDATGNVLRTGLTGAIDVARVDEVLDRFRGEQQQVPPMYSALKRDGVPLYTLARKGREVEREPRAICVYSLERIRFVPGDAARLSLRMRVSKGTYIRVLAEDIGAELGCGGHVETLTRLSAGGFTESDCVDLEQLEAMRYDTEYAARDAMLRPPVTLVAHLPELRLSDVDCLALLRGRFLQIAGSVGELVRVSDSRGQFCGIAEYAADGAHLRAKRMMSGGA